MYNYDGLVTAKVIREQREKLNLTQEKLAKQIGIELSKIKQYEMGDNGDMPLPEVQILCEFFGITMEYLLSGEEFKYNGNELYKSLNKPSKPCSCGNSRLVIDSDDAGFMFVFCSQCNKQGLRGKGIEEAMKIWNKSK